MGMGILTIALILTAILTHKHDTEKKKAKVEAEFLLEDVELEVEEEVREVNYEVKLIDRAPAVVKKKRSKK